MTVDDLIQYFKIDRGLLERAREDNPALAFLYQECLAIHSNFKIEIDNSPVMSSPDSFAAKIEHDARKIILNGFILAGTGDSPIVRKFLVFHELGHEVLKKPASFDLDLESVCDLIALRAVLNEKV